MRDRKKANGTVYENGFWGVVLRSTTFAVLGVLLGWELMRWTTLETSLLELLVELLSVACAGSFRGCFLGGHV